MPSKLKLTIVENVPVVLLAALNVYSHACEPNNQGYHLEPCYAVSTLKELKHGNLTQCKNGHCK